jgi:putative ABC transport system permease protein
MKYFMLVWAGLWRRQTRTLLTMLSIVVAFLLFGLLQGFSQGMNGIYKNLDVDRLYVQSRINITETIPIAGLTRVQSVPHVAAVTHWTYFGGFFRDSQNPLPLFAADIASLFKVYKDLKLPPEQLDTMLKTRTGMIVGKDLAERFNWSVGDRIPVGTFLWTQKSGSSNWSFDLVGIVDTSAYGAALASSAFVNYAYFNEARSFARDRVHFYVVRLDDPRLGQQVSKDIDALFENSANETKTQSEQAWAQAQMKQVADIDLIVNSIVGAVLFTLLFLTANTMGQSVRERVPELAVLKALGYSDAKVLTLVLVEAALVCIVSSLIGLLLAALVYTGLRSYFGQVLLPLVVVLAGIAIAIVLALVSGLPPALRAKRLKVVDALAGR